MGTEIQWTDETWNPVTGCAKVSPGCAHCYAERVAIRLWPSQYPNVAPGADPTLKEIRHGRPREFTDIQCHEDRLDQPLRWKKPRKVFVNSMSDLFHEDVPNAFIDKVFAVMALARQHTFQILTKRAERMRDYMRDSGLHHAVTMVMQGSADMGGVEHLLPARRTFYPRWPDDWPLPNVWLGVSVENQRFADERIRVLLQTPAAIRFISVEPQLEHIDLRRLPAGSRGRTLDAVTGWWSGPASDLPLPARLPGLDWVIVGGESGAGARPFDVAWARSIVKQCQAAGVPVFVKQLGAEPIDGRLSAVELVTGAAGRPRPADQLLTEEAATTIMGPFAGRPFFRRVALRDRKGGDMAEWPEDLRVREMPAVHA